MRYRRRGEKNWLGWSVEGIVGASIKQDCLSGTEREPKDLFLILFFLLTFSFLDLFLGSCLSLSFGCSFSFGNFFLRFLRVEREVHVSSRRTDEYKNSRVTSSSDWGESCASLSSSVSSFLAFFFFGAAGAYCRTQLESAMFSEKRI